MLEMCIGTKSKKTKTALRSHLAAVKETFVIETGAKL